MVADLEDNIDENGDGDGEDEGEDSGKEEATTTTATALELKDRKSSSWKPRKAIQTRFLKVTTTSRTAAEL